MKKLIIIVVLLVAGYGIFSYFTPSNEDVLEKNLSQMEALDIKDAENSVSETDVNNADTVSTGGTSVTTEIDTALAEISSFSETETTNPFDGL